jgi:glycosyltransferase involved in cell wall biosynthesis
MPRHVAAMDVGVVLDPGVAGFHYSPLKLREYMASGLAVVAPRSGEISRTLQDGKQALLIEPGSKDDLLGALIRLHDDQRLRKTLGMTARAYIVRTGTWGAQLERTEQVLAGLG